MQHSILPFLLSVFLIITLTEAMQDNGVPDVPQITDIFYFNRKQSPYMVKRIPINFACWSMPNVIHSMGEHPVYFYKGFDGRCEEIDPGHARKVGRFNVGARIRYRYNDNLGFWWTEQALQLNIHCRGLYLSAAGPHFSVKIRIDGDDFMNPIYTQFAGGDSIAGYIENGDQVLIFPLLPTSTGFPIPGDIEKRSASHLQPGYTAYKKGYYEEFVHINFYISQDPYLIKAVTNLGIQSCKVDVDLLSAPFHRD